MARPLKGEEPLSEKVMIRMTSSQRKLIEARIRVWQKGGGRDAPDWYRGALLLVARKGLF